jgi:hypothetical protein
MTLQGTEEIETAKRMIRQTLAQVRRVRLHEGEYELETYQKGNLRRVDVLLLDALTVIGL